MSVINEFEPFHDIPEDFFIIIYGLRRSGKTTMLMHMLESMQQRIGSMKTFLIRGSADVDADQYEAFPPGAIFSDVSIMDEVLGKIITDQKNAIEEAREGEGGDDDDDETENASSISGNTSGTRLHTTGRAHVRGRVRELQHDRLRRGEAKKEKTDKNVLNHGLAPQKKKGKKAAEKVEKKDLPSVLIVLDDVVNENSIRRSNNLRYIATTGRHINCNIIVLSQMVAGSGSVPPIVRTQSDIIIVTHTPRSFHERDLLAEQYLTVGDDAKAKRAGVQMLMQVTSVEFRALVIDVSNKTARRAEEYLYSYGPVPSPPKHISANFRLGTPPQWEESKEEAKQKRKRNFEMSQLPKGGGGGKRKPSSVGRHSNLMDISFADGNSFLPALF
jgi:hypothetical protein